jgi:phospholipid transport system transporter-binding protein
VSSDGIHANSDGIVELSGRLTFETVPDFLQRSSSWFEHNPRGITVDLGAVTQADSAGLALMLEWLGRARGAGRELRFVHFPQQIKHLIDVSGLNQTFGLS